MSYPTLPFGADDPTATTITLLDRYRVFDQRSGGMGTVFFADDTVFPRRVAIKTIRRERFADPAAFLRAADRFEREKTAAGMVSGQVNVVTVHDYVIGPDGTQYLILEYVPGGTLRMLLARDTLSTPDVVRRAHDAIRLVRDAARGLQAAHKVGIVHRDIKPENIFIAADGRAQVGDFGIAQIADLPTRTTEDLRNHPGTVGYMSPEQEHGTTVLLPASDQYALGLVLFELLTGTRFAALFPAQRDALLAAHPPALTAIVRRMTQEQPDARYPDMGAVIAALDAVIDPPPVPVPTAFVGHSADVQTLACTPNGEMLASGSKDGAICLWRVRDGTLLRTMRPQHFVATVMFASDGETLASGGVDGLVRIWRVADGLMLHALPGHGNTVCSVAYTPDGQFLVSGAWDKTVRLWRVADGASLGVFTGHGGVVYSVAVSPDGRLLASGSQDGTVRLWTNGQAHVLRGHRRPVHAIAFHRTPAVCRPGAKMARFVSGIPAIPRHAGPSRCAAP